MKSVYSKLQRNGPINKIGKSAITSGISIRLVNYHGKKDLGKVKIIYDISTSTKRLVSTLF